MCATVARQLPKSAKWPEIFYDQVIYDPERAREQRLGQYAMRYVVYTRTIPYISFHWCSSCSVLQGHTTTMMLADADDAVLTRRDEWCAHPFDLCVDSRRRRAAYSTIETKSPNSSTRKSIV